MAMEENRWQWMVTVAISGDQWRSVAISGYLDGATWESTAETDLIRATGAVMRVHVGTCACFVAGWCTVGKGCEADGPGGGGCEAECLGGRVERVRSRDHVTSPASATYLHDVHVAGSRSPHHRRPAAPVAPVAFRAVP